MMIRAMTTEPEFPGPASGGPPRHARLRGDAGSMFLGAAIFGFFGFYMFNARNPILLFELVKWTFQGAAVAFLLCGLLVAAKLPFAGAVCLVVEGLTAISLAILGAWHILDPKVGNGVGIILILVAVWNGVSVIRSLTGRARIGSLTPP